MPTYVLVHGAFRGGWCWKPVAARLRARGHGVHAPTLTGLGERSHLMHAGVSLETFIEDIAQLLHYEDLHDVVLVGHSFAGSVVSALADRMPERLRHLVYLDALVLESGMSPAIRSPDLVAAYERRASKAGTPLTIPPGRPQHAGIVDPAQVAWVQARITPHPLRTYHDKLVLRHPLGNGVPATYIACTAPAYVSTAESRARARAQPGWRFRELPTGHDAMLLMPDALSDMLLSVP